MTKGASKQKVNSDVVPPRESAQEIKATRASNAEQLAVERHQKINMIWEYTQAYMAILVITTVLTISCYVAITAKEDNQRVAALLFMTGLANLVAGFYFGRTNHTRPTGDNQ